MNETQKEQIAYVAFSNRTMRGIEDGVAYIVEQVGCSKEEGLEIIFDVLRKRICRERTTIK